MGEHRRLQITSHLCQSLSLRLVYRHRPSQLHWELAPAQRERQVRILGSQGHARNERAVACPDSRNEKDFEDANINIPIATAKAVKNAKNVKRFIYLSAAGSDPNSQSARLRTKWIGEQAVKAIYPDFTILRPIYMFNLIG